MLLICGAGEDSWESFWQHGDLTSQAWRKSTLNIHRKDWYWSRGTNILASWCEEPTHWKRSWCWERLRTGGEGVTKDEWLDGITDTMDMNLSKPQEIVKDREAWCTAGHGVGVGQRVGHDLMTEQQQELAYWLGTFWYEGEKIQFRFSWLSCYQEIPQTQFESHHP